MHRLKSETRARLVGALMGSLVFTTGCGTDVSQSETETKDRPAELSTRRDAVVYGHDEREDVYLHPHATLRARAHQSTVAMMAPQAINATNPNNVEFIAPTLQWRANLCSTERFLNDPTASSCSGTLIDDDLVLTQGTCIDTLGCEDVRFVFNYYRDSPISYKQVSTQDIFRCADVVVQKHGYTNGRVLNYAVVRLDRPATPRFTPAPVISDSGALAQNTPVAVVGTSAGTPFKLDTSGTVREGRPLALDYFEAYADTFGGQLGSAAYEQHTDTVVGVYTDGVQDYVANGSCNVAHLCPDTGCTTTPFAEEFTYARAAIDELCLVAPTQRLCGETAQANSLTYSRSNTLDATVNTADATLSLVEGQTVLIGTCGLPGSFTSGDTLLRLYNSANNQVAWNDDAFGPDNHCSFIRYTVPLGGSGNHTLRAGCFLNKACRATATWTTSAVPFQAVNTQSATVNTVNHKLLLTEGQRLRVGTCGLTGASRSGDTYLRLFDPQGVEAASNDDACGSVGSQIDYTVPTGKGGVWEVRAGCYSSSTCSGNLAWNTSGGTTSFVYSASYTASATTGTVNQDIALSAGQTLTVGTCGTPSAYTPDDSFLRLTNASGLEVAANDDGASCGMASSITYTVPADGIYQLRAGCYANDTCSGTVAYRTN